MAQKINKSRKPMPRAAGKKQLKRRSFFTREAEWMSWMSIAPFGIGVIIALVFWFTR